MSVEVLAAGPLTTVQDAGRRGLRHLGIGRSGALDHWALRVGNLLVGNREDAPALEITLHGPTLRFHAPARIALCGADTGARLDGARVPGWRPCDVPAGSTLRIGACRDGARALLALAGGIDVPAALGSASTDLRGGFGGLDGRALRRGDRLAVGRCDAVANGSAAVAPWWIDPQADADPRAAIRLLPGADAADGLCAARWRVAAASNRQGLRLEGAALAPDAQHARISQPVLPGTVQLPPDGRPIVLLADAQTHGGYPVVGHVATAELSRLARLRPGDALRFAWCSVDEARALACVQRQRLARIAMAIEARLRADRASRRVQAAPSVSRDRP
ncbi:biotin-dependent carboxyltransferase family protein [Coralloluteibacterium stylophorae]|uniref:Biotin-dependent carboxyltransferase family protein n=1 Tax=Coralloluteibacterium stylophorae TaxID=1776034 RepID=A0A8J7VUR9_9GAMM|nr:biotin-dependent carboxyltransferase family protein [Coralloluteibacterium stylophorae]MBS7458739.1 biotin-dependent carboxyltransferase family protein [Coralloluteibacterium stylophorae]